MPIDSSAKRFSVMHVFGQRGFVYPGGTFDADDRRDVIGDYRGIASGSVAPPVTEVGAGATRYLFLDLSRDVDFGLYFVGRPAMEGA